MVKKFKTFGPQLVFAEQTAGSVVVTNEQKLSLYKKSQKTGISTDVLEEVYRRGYSIWNESFGQTAEQFAFDRVNSFIAGGFAADLDEDLMIKEGKRGLWDNIHAKRERIKHGSGEHMRKPGSKGAPTDEAIKASQNEEADPCWDNYKQVGMKMKGGKKVPNCVPVKEENIEEKFSDEYMRKGRLFAKLKKARSQPQPSKEELRKMAADAVKNTAQMQKEEVKLHKGKHFTTGETSEKQSKNPNDPDSRFDGTKSAKNVYQKATPGQPVTEESSVDAQSKTAERAKMLDDLIAKTKEMQNPTVKTAVGKVEGRREFSSAGEVVRDTNEKTGAQTKTIIPNQATVRKPPTMTNTLTTVKKVVRESLILEKDDISTAVDRTKRFSTEPLYGSGEQQPAASQPVQQQPRAQQAPTPPASIPETPKSQPQQRAAPAPRQEPSSDTSGGVTKLSSDEASRRVMDKYGWMIKLAGQEHLAQPKSLEAYAKSVGVPVQNGVIGSNKPQSAGQLSQRIKQVYNYDVSPSTIKGYADKFGVKVDEAYEMIEQMILEDIARDEAVNKILEDWQDSKYKNPEGGLTRAGVMAYRRENPGSKLKTAVTTPPSKLKPGSKAANRRKSFCARMGGMKKRLTSAKTARDPDSRINKALRKWNCEETIYELSVPQGTTGGRSNVSSSSVAIRMASGKIEKHPPGKSGSSGGGDE